MVTSSSAALVHSGRANTSQLAGDRAEGSGEVEVEADRVDGQQSTDHDKRRNETILDDSNAGFVADQLRK